MYNISRRNKVRAVDGKEYKEYKEDVKLFLQDSSRMHRLLLLLLPLRLQHLLNNNK